MKRVYLSVFALVVATAMLASGTMAWFTASDNAGEAVFTAGTVSITADSTTVLSQYFDPSEAWYLYGVEKGTGDLYEINVKNGTVHRFYDTDMSVLAPTDPHSPNGLAYDNNNHRLYFSIIKGRDSQLWFYDLVEKELVYSGQQNNVTIYGGTYGMGYYWYLNNGTDALYRVAFDPEGKVLTSEFIKNITGDEAKKFNFGDVVIDIKDGIIYGSTSGSTANQEFFTYNIATGIYQKVANATALNLQLAFGSNGLLYGHHTNDKQWYEINPGNGAKTPLTVAGGRSFNDIASGYRSVWNPGDTSKMRFTVLNTGNKRIYVRAELTGEWRDAAGVVQTDLSTGIVNITPCTTTNWKIGTFNDETHFYYNGILAPNTPVEELCVEITLSTSADNDYQGMSFYLTGTMEAIQVTNGAAEDFWGVTLGFLPAP